MSITSTSRFAQSDDQVSTTVGTDTVILGMQDGVYYGLDTVGALVWAQLEEPRSVGELAATVTAAFDVKPARCEQDIVALLQDLLAHRLVRTAD